MNDLAFPTLLPRILLIEDNAISREFLYEALLPLGPAIDVAETLAGAKRLAQKQEHALFLCDVHLPDGEPEDILQSLKQTQADTTAIAITAETSPEARQYLLQLGYQEVWQKPIAMALLQNNVSRVMGLYKNIMPGSTKASIEADTGLWDEASAMRAVGNNQATLSALRMLFLGDLPTQIKMIEDRFERNDVKGLRAECHKLLAGCGFVGAASLSLAVKQLAENPEASEKAQAVIIQARRCLANG